jgi:alanine-glyoxylate transaminase/serine-glyoxylate transaminase/serine-pyruvate transaminase
MTQGSSPDSYTEDDELLLLIPGPTPVVPAIREALARPTIGHNSPGFATILTRVLDNLKIVFDNHAGKAFVFAGSGTLAQETALVNFLEEDDRLLVCSTGFFADRLVEIARTHAINAEVLAPEWGQPIDLDELRSRLNQSRPTAVAFTHVETSTGVMTPLEDIVPVIRESEAMVIVDGVAATGGVAEEMSRLGIDVVLTGSQKALGVPPGLAIVAVSDGAWVKREQRNSPVRSYYADLTRWLPSMEKPEWYFATHAVNMIRALDAGLRVVMEEGLDERYARHREMAKRFRGGMAELGFESLAPPSVLAPTLSVLRTPDGVSSRDFRQRMRERGVVASTGIKDHEDRIVRFGHMGNVTPEEIEYAVGVATKSLP